MSRWETLQTTETVLGGDIPESPLVLYRHGRWHLVTTGFLYDEALNRSDGISGVNFMSPARARQVVDEWYPRSARPVPFERVAPDFAREVEAKILPAAEDYRPLLRAGWVQVIAGHTSDTLHGIAHTPECESALIDLIAEMMQRGEAGPYLDFPSPWRAMRPAPDTAPKGLQDL